MSQNPADDINWHQIRHFSKDEFPDGVLKYLDGRVVRMLDDFREHHGYAVHPTPLYAGLVRHEGSKTSQHYVGPKKSLVRLSTAADVFPSGDPILAWQTATNMSIVGGIGLYLDTKYQNKNWPMLHLDIRERENGIQTWWVRVEGAYYYPTAGAVHKRHFYHSLLKVAKGV